MLELVPTTYTTLYHPACSHGGSSGGMTQSTSPFMSLKDERSNHYKTQTKYDQDTPIDPSITASPPTYHSHSGESPPQQDVQHGYPSNRGSTMYTQPRFEWPGYAEHSQHPMQGGYAVTDAQTPTSAALARAHPGQVSAPPDR
jgi:transcription factor CON7